MRSASLLLLSLPLLGGCYQWGESEYLGFYLEDLADPWFEFRSGGQVLLSSTPLCPEIGAERLPSGDLMTFLPGEGKGFRACFEETVTGPASLGGDGCLNFSGPGEVTWELTPNTCGEQVERMRFTLVEPGPDWRLGFDEHRLRFAADPAFGAELGPIEGLAPGRSTDELTESPDAPRHIVAGQVEVVPMRFDNAAGRVYWSGADGQWEIIGEGIETVDPSEYSTFAEWTQIGLMTLRMSPAAQGRLRVTLPGGEVYESPELIAVAQDAAVSLDLVTADDYLFADVRDAAGNLLHAAPIEWSLVEGALAIEPGESGDGELFTPEYASFWHGYCEPVGTEPELRRAVVRAKLGELEDTVDVEYLVEPPEDHGPGEPSETCLYADPSRDPDAEEDPGADEDLVIDDRGCACTTDGRTPTAPMLAFIGLLALVRRRDR